MLQKVYSNLSSGWKITFIVALLVGTAALSDALLYRPTKNQLQKIQEEIAKEEDTIKRNLRFLAYKDEIKRQTLQLDNFYTNKAQEESDVMNSFFREVEQIAEGANITYSKILPAGKEKDETAITYFVVIEGTGTLEDTIGFLHEIESANKLLKVVKYTLSAKASKPDKVQSTITISQMLISSNPNLVADNLVISKDTEEKPAS